MNHCVHYCSGKCTLSTVCKNQSYQDGNVCTTNGELATDYLTARPSRSYPISYATRARVKNEETQLWATR